MIVVSAIRFFRIAKEIDDTRTVADSGALYDFVMAGLLALLGLSMFLYLGPVIVPPG